MAPLKHVMGNNTLIFSNIQGYPAQRENWEVYNVSYHIQLEP